MPESDSEVYLSVVIPAYNEAKTIAETIRRVEAFLRLKGWPWEVVIVNDGSTDGTDKTARALTGKRAHGEISMISFEKNNGKGFVTRHGILASRGRIILLTDADLSAPIKEVDKLIKAIQNGAEVAIGSRAARKQNCDVRQTLKRKISGRIFNFLVRVFVLGGIRDTQCGFKCFTRKAAKDLFGAQRLDGFCFDVEVLYLARQMGYPIEEVPVMWCQGPRSKVSLFRDSVRMVKDLARIKRLHRCSRNRNVVSSARD